MENYNEIYLFCVNYSLVVLPSLFLDSIHIKFIFDPLGIYLETSSVMVQRDSPVVSKMLWGKHCFVCLFVCLFCSFKFRLHTPLARNICTWRFTDLPDFTRYAPWDWVWRNIETGPSLCLLESPGLHWTQFATEARVVIHQKLAGQHRSLPEIKMISLGKHFLMLYADLK